MSDDGSTLLHDKTIFDSWRSITIALYMALVGYGVMVGIPVISSAWVDQLGFSEVEVGRVAGADLGGLAIGAYLASLYIAKFNRRLIVIAAVVVAISANVLCITMVTYEQTLWLRLIAGIGSGAYTAVAIATLGGTSRPAQAFNLLLFTFAFSQAGELWILPKLTMNGIYIVFIGSFVVGLFFLHWLPSRPVEKGLDVKVDIPDAAGGHHSDHVHVPAYVPWMVLTAMVFTYINIGAYWTYIELASKASTASPDWVAKLLIATSFFSILGCLFATVISNRFGLARPLLVTLVVQSLIVVMLANGINNTNVMIGMFSFNFLWIFIDVYQMSTVANVDHSGRFAARMPSAQGIGQLIGPNVAASVLAAGYGYRGVFIMCATSTMIAMAIYLFMYLRLKKAIPALADAS